MAQCAKCNGTGRVVSQLNAFDPNKVGAGMGMHRCDRCAGTGVVHGAGGGGSAAQQARAGLTAIVTGLFLHPVFSFVGFWVIGTGLMLLLVAGVVSVLGMDEGSPPAWYYYSGMGMSGVMTWSLRRYVHRIMRWTFYLIIGGLVLAMVVAIVTGVNERSGSG